MNQAMTLPDLCDSDYEALAGFRHALRGFLQFSETAAQAAGLTPQQHQAMLAIRAAPGRRMTVGDLAERLMLRPHSTTGLVDRMMEAALLLRVPDAADRRKVHLMLTPQAEATLAELSATHRAELARIRPLLTRILASIEG
jgi:DNA-binding MarR family transcriptional regulator